jgi:SPW repeat-containing protein
MTRRTPALSAGVRQLPDGLIGGIGIVSPDRATRHRAIDVALLICVVGLAIATWTAISHADRLSAWTPCFGVAATIFLALAALTPHALGAAAARLVMSGWLMIAPWLLAFADLPLARWSHLVIGCLIAAVSASQLLHQRLAIDRTPMPT